MTMIGTRSARELVRMLSGGAGVGFSIAELAAKEGVEFSDIGDGQILNRNIAAELLEKAEPVQYPALYVYCDKITNSLKEKFRTFSGTAALAIEVRASHERLDELEQRIQLYTDAVTDVLSRNRGDWSPGIFYPGGYEVQFGAVKQGGKRFLQIAKVRLEVNISVD
jgi:hypothetical protein